MDGGRIARGDDTSLPAGLDRNKINCNYETRKRYRVVPHGAVFMVIPEKAAGESGMKIFAFRGGCRLHRRFPLFCALVMALFVFAGCGRRVQNRVQGYVEGEFVYVASPFAGALVDLRVQRGEQVKAGQPLFRLESEPEKDAADEAARRLAQARSLLRDEEKGKRPSEMDSLEAQLRQAQAALAFSQKEFSRQEKMLRTAATSRQDLDSARSSREQARERVAQWSADLETARLGSREDQIRAAKANVQALDAALAQAEWNLAQKRQAAPKTGLVFDTLYREGEWVPSGRPVVVLLPPENIKVRAFVPETLVGGIHPGAAARVFVDGVSRPFTGRVSFISPQAEYTPPVIYSRQSREKFVFMIEITFDPETASKLHPGQPVDVELGAGAGPAPR